MNVTLYGAKEQKKLAAYPERIQIVQKRQDAIPKIKELNLKGTRNLRENLERYLKELRVYEASMVTVAGSYRRLIEELTVDCENFENEVIAKAPADISDGNRQSLMTSLVQTKQQLLFVKQQFESLDDQITNVRAAKTAINIAIRQNSLANLTQACTLIMSGDIKIRNLHNK